MSLPQSRSDKSDFQNRKLGRSGSSGNQQRNFSGKGSGSGGGSVPPASSLSSNRSFKKPNNAQGGQSRTSVPNVNFESSNVSAPQRTAQNVVHLQPPLHASDVPAGIAAKPVESSSTQRSNRAVPKAPSSQSATMSSDTTVPTTPAKRDAPMAFPLQFGSISPAFVNGMQIPARTSSAPPNLDEQKYDQARHESFRSGPMFPIPSVPKQQLPRKDAGMAGQSNAEAHPTPKAKIDAQVSSASTLTQTHKPSVVPMGGMSVQMPFHQPQQVPVHFGAPNPQIHSQGMTSTSLHMPLPMPLPMGNASQVQQQVFVPNLQPHPMQHQGIMHQMGPQIPPQLANLGIGIAPQFPQHLAGKFGSPRRPVKITDPKTHKDVRLDQPADTYVEGGSTGVKSHSNVPQSQPIPPFTPGHPLNYYPNTYNANSRFFTAPSSLPITSTQVTPSSQGARFNYSVSQGQQATTFGNLSTHNSLSINKIGASVPGTAELPNVERARDVPISIPSSKIGASVPGTAELPNVERARDVHSSIPSSPLATTQVSVKPAAGSIGEKVVDSSQPISSAVEKDDSPKLLSPSGEANSFHPQRGSEKYPESSIQQPKPVVGVYVSTTMPVADKQPAGASTAVSVDRAASNTSSTPLPDLEGTASVFTNTDGRKKETISRSSSIKDNQKKLENKWHSQSQPQVAGQSTSILRLPSLHLEHNISSSNGVPETVETKIISASTATGEGVLESTRNPLSNTSFATPETSESSTGGVGRGSICEPVKVFGSGDVIDTLDAGHDAEQDRFKLQDEGLKNENVETEEKQCLKCSEVPRKDTCDIEISCESNSAKSAVVKAYTELDPVQKVTSSSAGITLRVTEKEDEPVSCQTEIDKVSDNVLMSNSSELINSELSPPFLVAFTISHGDKASLSNASSNISHYSKEVSVEKSDKKLASVLPPYLSESALKKEGECVDNIVGGLVSLPVFDSNEKPVVEPSRAKNTVSKSKKKLKEVLQRADAAGTTSDLYMAYKGPDEKKDAAISSESTSNSIDLAQVTTEATQKDVDASKRRVQSKAEPDDWEDAADISTPKLETLDNGEMLTKKYTRDFLLKFAELCTDLPEGFETTSDIEALIGPTVNVSHLIDRDSHPSPGKIVDRSTRASRPDRRGSVTDDDRWSKQPGPLASGRDLRLDINYGGNVVGLRPGQGGSFGVLRNPRTQAPVPYAGGILSGPMQSMGSQGGMQRNNSDADRWQRAADSQKGLIPSPHTPLQVMHRAERKYEIGKVSDEEEAKQRQLKAILNKLTPQNFEKLFQKVKEVNIDNVVTLNGVISQIFDKALMEPTFCEMYANFCHHLAGELPDFSENKEKITFKRLLLNKCQEEFERGEMEQEEANRVEEGEIKQSKEEREEKRVQARKRMLGNIRLIGELYKEKMLTEKIMHSCINKLLGQNQNPDEEDIEALCKLMSTIGEMIDRPIAKEHMDAYFDIMANLSNNMKFSSRVRFMLKDAIDLRNNKWQQRRKVEGPKKIEDVHRDAAQERHAQAQVGRQARGPSINSSVRRGANIDFGPRGSTMLSSPGTQMGNFRGVPPQVRGYGHQDVRSEERQSYEARPLSVPLPQRHAGDDSITLGPQGGLARGMSNRGPLPMSSISLADLPPSPGDSRRMTGGVNGYNASTDQATYGSKEFLMPRYAPERFVSPSAYDQSSGQERNMPYGNRNPDRSFDGPLATSPPTQVQGPTFTQNNLSEKVSPEGRLHEMSLAAIKEFYSAKDEKEVALCIKDLNSPSFHPTMTSLWVTDSFERKDMERDLLAKLLVNLIKSRDGLLTQRHLLKGFESVLTTLEDAVNDAPKAAEFLGRIFAKTILENVIPIDAIGELIYRGGEQPGSLLENGLAADVLGSILEIIKLEKGDIFLNEVRSSSNLRLADFRPPGPVKSRKLEKFM